ncbi:MAG TPA: hypothetical protein DEQ68_04210 [Ruminococcaceae bacterium]|nr:hypothetical protein [Oscillospiraceae bacterium]
MYKKQMKFQKVICVLMLIASAVVFIYSLGLVTDLYDSLYLTMMDPEDLSYTMVEGSQIYYEMQGYDPATNDFTGFNFNAALTMVGIGLILVNLILFITCTHSRRKYYIGNYIAVGLSAACSVGASVWAIFNVIAFREKFLQIDFDALKEFSEMWNTHYSDSTMWFDAVYFVFGFLLLMTALLVANLILKVIVMKKEQRLIGSRKDVRA